MKEILYILLAFNYNADTDSVNFIDTYLLNNIQECEIRLIEVDDRYDTSLCFPVDMENSEKYPLLTVMTNVFKGDDSKPEINFSRAVSFSVCSEMRRMANIATDTRLIRTFCNIVTK